MERASEKVTYRCRLCRHQLFDSSCVLNSSTIHHVIAAASTSTECLPDQSSTSATPSTTCSWALHGDVPSSSKTPTSLAQGRGQTGGPSGVIAPYGQITGGSNPLWFINEDSTPPWVQETLNEFQWKKGKLSCPKCNGRLGSFDFVTPYKLHCGSQRSSRIHIMRSRVDCESSSPIIARIRPMPQHIPGTSHNHSYDSEGAASPLATSTSRQSAGVDISPELPDNDPAVLLSSSSSFLPAPTDSTSRNFLPEAFSSASDEETLSSLPNSSDYQRTMTVSRPIEQQRNHACSNSRNPSMVAHIEQSFQAPSSTCRTGRLIGATTAQSNPSFQLGGLDHVRHQKIKPAFPVDRTVPFGLESGQSRYDADPVMVSPQVERNVAYVAGTNRAKNRIAKVQSHLMVTQPSTSSGHMWQYNNRSDDEDLDERIGYYPSHPATSASSSSTSVAPARPMDISSDIFKNTQTFLRPFITRQLSSDRARNQATSSSPPPNLYSQIVPSSEQRDSTSPIPRELRLTSHTVPNLLTRDSDEEDEIPQAGDIPLAEHTEIVPSNARPRSPREQRRERNRKKKERRKQRRYERWLERQTLGEEEESAIQDISAAGLYALLGPRCAGSSLRDVTTCSVCLDIYYMPHTCFPCKHFFCEPCLRQVARFHPEVTPCPLCRTTIRTVKLHEQLTSAVKQLFPRQFENRQQMERRTLNRSFPLPGNSNLSPWYRMGYQNSRNQADLLTLRNPGYVHDWGMRYLQGVVWRVVASTVVLLIVSGISVGFLHFMFDFS